MRGVVSRPDVRLELLRLKDFQRDAAEHVFRRLYVDPNPVRRFLVADEVGLGKTMVARGIIARVVDALWNDVSRIDIVYICSNASIARQNISRLNITGAKDANLPTRITLLPTAVHGLKDRKLNFISLTPQTSFELRSKAGTAEERALLYWLLPDEWRSRDTATRNALQGWAERDRFRKRVDRVRETEVDSDLREAFRTQLSRHPDLQSAFRELCDRFAYSRQHVPADDRAFQNDIVGRLRLALAVSCLSALEPDLVILDEFQRFKQLLDGTDQASELARELFTFGDARILLLSATPYKMYTSSGDDQADDHFRDFLQTISFLHADPNKTERFGTLLDDYRTELFRLSATDSARLKTRRDELEVALREVMVRTERLAVTPDRNGMLTEVRPHGMTLEANDVTQYVSLARVARIVRHAEVIEYWKSAPYLLNFMDTYEFKQDVKAAVASTDSSARLLEALALAPGTLLNWNDVEGYRGLDPGNARIRWLIRDVLREEICRLLWVPPTLPYYKVEGPFGHDASRRFTKRLVFSSWQVVPKVVAALLSYEAERRVFDGEGHGDERPNTPEARARRRPLLRFARREGRLTGLPVLGLLYPSITLAEMGDPLGVTRQLFDRDQGAPAEDDVPGVRSIDFEAQLPSAAAVLNIVEREIQQALDELSIETTSGGPADERWYWAAPVLMDLHRYSDVSRAWLAQPPLADVWRGEEAETKHADTGRSGGDREETFDAWLAHVHECRRLAERASLGPRPPDLASVLARVAVGGPAVAALRALARVLGDQTAVQLPYLRNMAGWIAWGFRTLFNLPEVTAMTRALNPEEPYWLRVAEYGVDGCLQAVLDEYAHVLVDWEGVGHRPRREAARALARRMAQSLHLRTANVGVDVIETDAKAKTIQFVPARMRARFAVRFGSRQADEREAGLRLDDVRTAFNSPFWPFVLCSTSVGQEGLDFHLYSHAVVHWNLPSNPVDLEQREGRVHRFKGHAIRKNVAMAYGDQAFRTARLDPWEGLFEYAVEARGDEASDLVPYWVFSVAGGARIERHVPALPLSRDIARANQLRAALTVYRLAFGQSRQEDLVNYLEQHIPEAEIGSVAEELRIDLSPPKAPPLVMTEGELSRLRYRRDEPEHETDGEHVASDPSLVTMLSVDRIGELLDRYCLLSASAAPEATIRRYRDVLDRYSQIAGPVERHGPARGDADEGE